MIFRESAVVVLRRLELVVVGCGELPVEVVGCSGQPVVVEVNCSSKPVVMVEDCSAPVLVVVEDCNGLLEVEAVSILCTVGVMVAEGGVVALVEVVEVSVVVVSCSSRGLVVVVKIEAMTASEVEVKEGECSKLEFAVVLVVMAAVDSMFAAEEVAAMGTESMSEVVTVMWKESMVEVVMGKVSKLAVVTEESTL